MPNPFLRLRSSNCHGFTLVEMLIALALTGIIGSSMLNLYLRSSRVYTAQLQITEVQQNLRAGLDALTTDLRMAGYVKGSTAVAGVLSAGRKSVHFTMDLNRDGDCNDANEDLTYSLYKSSGIPRLGRKSAGGNNSPVAEYVEAMVIGGQIGILFCPFWTTIQPKHCDLSCHTTII